MKISIAKEDCAIIVKEEGVEFIFPKEGHTEDGDLKPHQIKAATIAWLITQDEIFTPLMERFIKECDERARSTTH